MGHLFSKALKRLTQCGGRNQLPAGGESQPVAGRTDREPDRPAVQAILLGQSIDSAEYAAFKTSSNSLEEADGRLESAPAAPLDDKENAPRAAQDQPAGDQSKPEVEEAVIKIQALVRGHLTRKALKDAQQQAATVPPNALGQSQFDEESLNNPPNAVFSNASPAAPGHLYSANSNSNSDNSQQQTSKHLNSRVPPLESIAEDAESAVGGQPVGRDRRPRLSLAGRGSAGPAEPQPGSPSPEANVSIDIQCDAPASASIDIKDHALRPQPVIAAVLHHNGLRTEPARDGPAGGPHQQPRPARRFDLAALADNSSAADEQPSLASSLPASPPHINLAASMNSHSIDSAEAAAIRIQSAFRGYHTRKHSPYRRRSPAGAGPHAPASSPANHINGEAGPRANGQSKRNTLRQQDAAASDDDEGVEGCERLAAPSADGDNDAEQSPDEPLGARLEGAGQESEESRRSRQRHRPDEPHPADDLRVQTPVKNTTPALVDDTDDQSTVKEVQADRSPDGSAADGRTAPSGSGALTGGDGDDELADEQLGEPLERERLSLGDAAKVRWSTSQDTESSNLGAALSMNEDLSEGLWQISQERDGAQPQDPARRQRDSLGAGVEVTDEAPDDPANESRDDPTSQQIDELDRITSQLEAALDEATDDYFGGAGKTEENLSDRMLEEETQQNLNELESDDIERRHPSGLVSEDRANSPAATACSQQPALVAADSLNGDHDDHHQPDAQVAAPHGDSPARLEVVSPDEAIGSGASSPMLAASHDGNSSDEGADSDQEQEEEPHHDPAGPSGNARLDNNQPAGSGGRSKRRNRNKRKGKK